MKQGGPLAIEALLDVLLFKFESGEMEFSDFDQAILLANALVEVTPFPHDRQKKNEINDKIRKLL